MQQAHKLEPFLMSSVSRCVLGHPEGKIGKVKSTDDEVREGVKFCNDNKYRGDIGKVKVKSPDDEVKIETFRKEYEGRDESEKVKSIGFKSSAICDSRNQSIKVKYELITLVLNVR